LHTKRQFKDLVREPLKDRAQMGQTLFISILVGLIYLQIDDGQEAIQDRLGSIFFIMTAQSLGAVTNVVTTFIDDKSVFLREHSNKMYRTLSFYLSKILVDLVFQLLYPFIGCLITYFMVGYKLEAASWILFTLFITLAANIGSCLGLLISIIAKDIGMGTAMVPIVVIPFMIFSGFFINSKNVPNYFIWCEYVSFMKYAFAGMVYNELTDQTFTCSDDERVPYQDHPGEFKCRIPDGETQLELLDFQDVSVGANIGILLGMYVFYRIVGFFLLWMKARQKANA